MGYLKGHFNWSPTLLCVPHHTKEVIKIREKKAYRKYPLTNSHIFALNAILQNYLSDEQQVELGPLVNWSR